jgi:hypothetical protein
MAFPDLPLIDQLRQLIAYDPATGLLTWRERTSDAFSDTSLKGKYVRTAQATCQGWNTKYAGKLALNVRGNRGHLQGRIGRAFFFAHRVAWAIHYGREPVGEIDHINGIPTDNRIENLRDVGRIENMRNVKVSTRNTSGLLGVRQDPRTESWIAEIGGSGEPDRSRIHLGTYRTKAEAAAARRGAEIALEYHPNHGRR